MYDLDVVIYVRYIILEKFICTHDAREDFVFWRKWTAHLIWPKKNEFLNFLFDDDGISRVQHALREW